MLSPAIVTDSPEHTVARATGPVPSHPSRGRIAAALLLAAAVAFAAWLPFLGRPLTADESGFWLLARHWTPGSSLYGDYWVDRPPLLLWLFALAGQVGGAHATAAGVAAPAVKLLGATASGIAVLLAGVVSGLLRRGSDVPRPAVVILAVALLSSPLLGMPETDGEVLAVPFVLLGLLALLAAVRRPWDPRAGLLMVLAGGSGMAAALVKQNVVDVFVFAAVALVPTRGAGRRAWARAGAFAAGSIAVLAAVLGTAAARGTSPTGLWRAIVVFRLHASAVIGTSASAATADRAAETMLAFLFSGAGPVLLTATALVTPAAVRNLRGPSRGVLRRLRTAGDGLTAPALALVGWELCGVALGGSYWLHYLTGLVPGMVVLVGLTRPARRPTLLGGFLAYAVAASMIVWTQQVVTPRTVSADARVEAYLRHHARPSDGVVAAFGHPDVVLGSGLESPYPDLWSLPVRVRDPGLRRLRAVVSGPAAPRWMIVAGDGLGSWGLDARSAQRQLERHYVERTTYGDWHVWRRRERNGR